MPWLKDHQKEAIQKIASLNSQAGVFIDVGGGKTRVALAYTKWRRCRRILVVLPGYVTGVWQEELEKIYWDTPVLDLTHRMSTVQRAAALREFGDGIVFVTYEGYWRKPLRDRILRWRPTACILDEVQRIRARASNQSRFAGVIAKQVPVRLALSATPTTNGIQDAWSIFRFIDPTIWSSWPDFRDRYLVYGGYKGYSITSYNHVEEVEQIIAAHSFQWTGPLPPAPDIPIYVDLSPATRQIYDHLKKESVAQVQDAYGKERDIFVKIALTQATRLQQITSGFAREVGGECIDVGHEKADATVELVTDLVAAKKQVVIFCRYLHDLDILQAALKKEELRVGRIQGGMPNRDAIVRSFDAGKLDVIVAQIRSVSLGIDLAAAHVGIFYSVSFSLDDFLQAKGRLTGALRQRHDVVFYHMITRKTVDEKIYKNLKAKTNIARRITSLRFALDLLE